MSIKGKQIFLTGGAGFIGTKVIEKLVDDNKIIVYDNLSRDSLGKTDLLHHKNIELIKGDILNLNHLSESIKDSNIIIHLAAIAGVDTVLRSPVKTMTVNVIGTYNVLESASKLINMDRLMEFSTSEVFGTYAFKVDEKSSTSQGSVGEARWTYSVSKLTGEHFAHAYFKEKGMPTVGVRPFNIYGPGQVGEGAIHHFVKKAILEEDLVVHGDGSQIRAWCYVDDIVDGILLALENPDAVGQSFNIGNPTSTVTVFDLAERIVRLSKSRSKIIFKPITYTDIEIRIPNIDKAKLILGYEPKVHLDEGILKTIEWYRNNLGV
ncbi:MAG: NAD-dependent epimerase/dehydratase family protein [Cyanobacteriota bacterium]